MFASIGVHPLLGLSALAGLVGLFAYAKALLELRDLGVDASAVALISKGDFADFALRLGVPFILLVAVLVTVVGSWVAALKSDHRDPLVFFVSVAGRAPLILVLGFAIYWWAPTQGPNSTFALLLVAILAIVIPALLLIAAGRTRGVDADDRCQLVLLWLLRALASPLGLLAAFILLGAILVSSNGISVLFSPGEAPSLAAAGPMSAPAADRCCELRGSRDQDGGKTSAHRPAAVSAR